MADRISINIEARHLAQHPLEAVLTNEAVRDSLTRWKDEFDSWKAEIATVPDFFSKPSSADKVGNR